MEKLLSFIWPIKKEEFGKFFPLALMLFFTILNYKMLKSTKDSLIVPAIGAEAVQFVKFYFGVPSAVLFTMFYMKIANVFYFKQIYYGIGAFFILYFILFAFILYPYQDLIHPDPEVIKALIDKTATFLGFKFSMSHLKWFLLMYGKWMYVLFYILAELWSSSMTFVLFWQFSNQIVPTNQAKRFYPMINLVGSAGTFIAGTILGFLTSAQLDVGNESETSTIMKNLLSITAVSTVIILLLFYYVNKVVLVQERYIGAIKVKKLKEKLSFAASLKAIFSSKYLGYIVVLVLSYGMAINLLEGPWKDSIKSLYPSTIRYLSFMGKVNQCNGLLAIVFSIIGVTLLKRYSWFVTALVTPVMIFITGVIFYSSIVFHSTEVFLGALFNMDTLLFTVMFGAGINIFALSSKFGLFDSTKEMTYIPISDELKSKGKAVVDVIGARFAKSASAFIQTLLFMLFPFATYSTIAPLLMVLFIVVAIVWILDVRLLNKEYLKYLSKLSG